jgi:hypothetical protein
MNMPVCLFIHFASFIFLSQNLGCAFAFEILTVKHENNALLD